MAPAAVDPDPDGRAFKLRHGIGDDSQAIGKLGNFYVHENRLSWKANPAFVLKPLCGIAARPGFVGEKAKIEGRRKGIRHVRHESIRMHGFRASFGTGFFRWPVFVARGRAIADVLSSTTPWFRHKKSDGPDGLPPVRNTGRDFNMGFKSDGSRGGPSYFCRKSAALLALKKLEPSA
jgi:hypothetical protein